MNDIYHCLLNILVKILEMLHFVYSPKITLFVYVGHNKNNVYLY